MADAVEVLGDTQTERLIHLALTNNEGPLTITSLLPIVGGSAEYVVRVLRSMLRDGTIKKVTICPVSFCPEVKVAYRSADVDRIETGYLALNHEKRAGWLTPWDRWERDVRDGFVGRRSGQHNTIPIISVAALQKEIDRLWHKIWFKLGDERALRALFPEFSTAVA
jgi:hypothetical protein